PPPDASSPANHNLCLGPKSGTHKTTFLAHRSNLDSEVQASRAAIVQSAMSPASKVVCVGPTALDFIFDPIGDGLRQGGYDVAYYTDYSHFERESATVMESAGVMVTVGSFPCTRELMISAPHLCAVVSPFIGTEGVDEAAATALGIIVANGQVA